MQVATGDLNMGHLPSVTVRQRLPRVVQHHLTEAQHGIERRPEFMAHARQELGLRRIGCLGGHLPPLGFLKLVAFGQVGIGARNAQGRAVRRAQHESARQHRHEMTILVTETKLHFVGGLAALKCCLVERLHPLAIIGVCHLLPERWSERFGWSAFMTNHLQPARRVVGLPGAQVQVPGGVGRSPQDQLQALLRAAQLGHCRAE